MKTFSVNKASWHYRLNVKMCKTNERLNRDDYAEKFVQSKDNICSYWRMSLWSMFKVAVVVAFLIGATALLLFSLYKLGYVFVFHTTQAFAATSFVIVGVSLLVGIVYLMSRISDRKKRKLDAILYDGETETSLAKAKYSSWKGGVCVPVEFKE